LELPDVLIYGTDVELRKPDKKAEPPQTPPLIQKRSLISVYVPPPVIRTEARLTPTLPAYAPQHTTSLAISYGSFQTAKSALAHWREWSWGTLGLRAEWRRSQGPFSNSHFNIGSVSGQFTLTFSPQVTGRARFLYWDGRYGLWGSSIKSYERKVAYYRVLSSLSYDTPGGFHLQVSYEHWKFPLKIMDIPSPATVTFKEKIHQFTLNVSWRRQALSLALNGRYLMNKTRYPYSYMPSYSPQGSQRYKDEVGRTTLKVSWKGRNFAWTGGILLDLWSVESPWGTKPGRSRSRLSPHFEGSFWLRPSVRVFLNFRQFYRYRLRLDLWQENPFFCQSLPSQEPEDWRFSGILGVEWSPPGGFSLKMAYQRHEVRNFAYWLFAGEGDVFIYSRIPSLQFSTLSADIAWPLREFLRLKLRSLFTITGPIQRPSDSEVGPAGEIAPNIQHVPYLESFRISLALNWGITPSTILEILSDYVGPRFCYASFPTTSSEIRLQEYWFLRAKIRRTFGKAELFLEAVNLLDDKFVKWYGYPEWGFQMYGGIHLKI